MTTEIVSLSSIVEDDHATGAEIFRTFTTLANSIVDDGHNASVTMTKVEYVEGISADDEDELDRRIEHLLEVHGSVCNPREFLTDLSNAGIGLVVIADARS